MPNGCLLHVSPAALVKQFVSLNPLWLYLCLNFLRSSRYLGSSSQWHQANPQAWCRSESRPERFPSSVASHYRTPRNHLPFGYNPVDATSFAKARACRQAATSASGSAAHRLAFVRSSWPASGKHVGPLMIRNLLDVLPLPPPHHERLPRSTRLWACVASVVCALLFSTPCRPQQSGPSLQATTQEHLETEAWWPTMSSFPLREFAGSDACAGCHLSETSVDPSSMKRAAALATRSVVPRGKAIAPFSLHDFKYSLSPSADGIRYTVSHADRELSHQLGWVMGAGALGQTFLYQENETWYQSEVSFYKRPSSLDVTTGLSPDPGPSLEAALGQALTPEDARLCFGCHTVHATTQAGLNPLHAEAGIGCEACHGPGLQHVNRMGGMPAAQNGPAHESQSSTAAIFNPAKLSPADSIDFCGACHRTFADANASAGFATSNAVVRFQPYRLEESKCWRATQDARLTCIGCHDPHQPLNRNSDSYDKQCIQCHTAAHKDIASLKDAAVIKQPATAHAVAASPKITSGCVRCHMPKVAIASMHGEFTDHYIRIVRPEEGFPR
jgi:hypothetical protein